jgi:hypothetical protein
MTMRPRPSTVAIRPSERLPSINAAPEPGAMVGAKPKQEGAMRQPQELPPIETLFDPPVDPRVVTRPDGFYWLDEQGRREVGPFATYEAAQLSLHADEHSDVEPEETLAEAEDEIGIADWIDPDTGEPAEEARPRLEDH